jgi:hypothetical protein
MARRRSRKAEEEEALSETQGPALLAGEFEEEEEEEEMMPLDDPSLDELAYGDPDLLDLNSPEIEQLGEPPMIGGASGIPSDLFGQEATTMGRAMSPRLYAQAAQFPTCAQLRVWRWENGIPVGLGAIDANASEEDLVREFYEAMPKPGEGRVQFKMRPIDLRGQELGKEITLVLSEHHSAVQRIRRMKEMENNGRGERDYPFFINQGGDSGAGATYAEEMGRMFEKAVEAADQRTSALEASLDEERDRIRRDDSQRAQERVDMATSSAQGVQALTERMMRDESGRSERSMQQSRQQSETLLTTLTTVFQQQQAAAAQQGERQRAIDDQRLQQERVMSEKQQSSVEERRLRDREEWERRRQGEREASEARSREEQGRLDQDRQRLVDQRNYELEQMRIDAEKHKLEVSQRQEQMRLEWEQRRVVEKEELERKERQRKEEWEQRRMDWDRQLAREREERDSRSTRGKEDSERRTHRSKEEADRREAMLREELRERETARQEQQSMVMKQMEVGAQRDREHAERMVQSAQDERSSQGESRERRERMERESRDLQEGERRRQHELKMREMEMGQQRDREHQERMMSVTQAQMQANTFGGLTDVLPRISKTLGALGVDTSELLPRLLGGGGDSGGGWSEAVPKLLGSLAEIGKVAIDAKAQSASPRRPQLAVPPMYGVPMGDPRLPPGMAPQMPPGAQMRPPAPMPQGMPHSQPPMNEPQFDRRPSPMEPMGFEEVDDEAFAPEEFDEMSIEERNLEVATEAGLALQTQKRARKAIRELVKQLRKAPDKEWHTHIAAAISMEIAIYHYIKATTVAAALAEAGADEELGLRILEALRQSDLIPTDVPYGDE